MAEDLYGKDFPPLPINEYKIEPEYQGESTTDEDNARDITKDRQGFYASDKPDEVQQGISTNNVMTSPSSSPNLEARKEAVERLYRTDYPNDDAYFKALDRLARWLSGEDLSTGQGTPA